MYFATTRIQVSFVKEKTERATMGDREKNRGGKGETEKEEKEGGREGERGVQEGESASGRERGRACARAGRRERGRVCV